METDAMGTSMTDSVTAPERRGRGRRTPLRPGAMALDHRTGSPDVGRATSDEGVTRDHAALATEEGPRVMIHRDRRSRAVRAAFLALLLLLIPQFVLGMVANLYVALPRSLPGGNAWGWTFAHSAVIQTHVYLGTLLLILALVAAGLGLATRWLAALAWSLAGLAMILLAWLSGELFLSSGQQTASSLGMAIGFLGAFVAYGLGVYTTRPR